ncbi:MAG: hypothetical protein GQ574_07120 [Crocinitomix sp.]|nr:hypothetical protein [Crocinitomix sp.]
MSEYYFKHQTTNRAEIKAEFEEISQALDCDNTFNFRFNTNSITSFKELVARINNSKNFDVALESKIPLQKQIDFSSCFSFYSNDSLELFNLTVLNQEEYKGDPEDEWMHDYNYPLVALVLVKTENRCNISIRVEDDAKKAKSKKKQAEIIAYRLNVFNAFLDTLGIKAIAEVGISDGSDYTWKQDTQGVVIKKLDGDKPNYTITNTALGCKWIHYSLEENIDDINSIFTKLIQFDFFAKRKGEMTVYTKPDNLIELLNSTQISIENISNIVSQEIAADESLFKAMLEIERFEGNITLKRPYSFNNSLADNLGIRLDLNELYCFADAAMNSKSTINKFLKKISKPLEKEIAFEEY